MFELKHTSKGISSQMGIILSLIAIIIFLFLAIPFIDEKMSLAILTEFCPDEAARLVNFMGGELEMC